MNCLLKTLTAIFLLFSLLGCSKYQTRLNGSFNTLCKSKGISSKKLKELVQVTKKGKYHNVKSILIFYKDSLILEKYFRGSSHDRKVNIHSCAKSVVSILTGISIDKKNIESKDCRIIDIFNDQKESMEGWDSLKRSTTVENLLMMTTGWKWNEETVPYDNDTNSLILFNRANDKLRHIGKLPLVSQPGKKFYYNSGAPFLLSMIITKMSRMPTDSFANNVLFQPLGIHEWKWIRDESGITYGQGELFLRPIDLLKIGRIVIDSGKTPEGKQIITDTWLRNSFYNTNPTSGLFNYGYGWWIFTDRHPHMRSFIQKHKVIEAAGMGGQLLWIIPDLKFVAVTTAENDDYHNIDNNWVSEAMLWEYILPALGY